MLSVLINNWFTPTFHSFYVLWFILCQSVLEFRWKNSCLFLGGKKYFQHFLIKKPHNYCFILVLPPHWQSTPLILRIFKCRKSNENHNQDLLLLLHLLDLTSLVFCINQGHMKGKCWILIANLMRHAWNIDWTGEKVKWSTMCLILRFILDGSPIIKRMLLSRQIQ